MKIIKSFYLKISLAIVVVAVIFLIVNIRFIHHQSTGNKSSNGQFFSVETFRTGENGWGYNILNHKKVIIKQDIIPAVQRLIPFQSEADARKTAYLVIYKLNHKKLPTITISELDSLHIFVPNKIAASK